MAKFYQEAELKKIQEFELGILSDFMKICDENGLRYFAFAGTGIGAVRHKGFIPWDDDIDIQMTRPDYEKFLNLFPAYAKQNGLMVVNHTTKPYYGRNFSKIIDCDTVLIEPQYKTDDPIGVFVDIWPLDGLPENKVKRYFYDKRAVLLSKLILASSMKKDKSLSFFKRAAIFFAGMFNPHKLVLKLERMAKKYPVERSKFIKCYLAGSFIFSRDEYKEKILLPFEDTEFFAPAEYDLILKKEYGNYMQLPPLEERVPHHVINTYYK